MEPMFFFIFILVVIAIAIAIVVVDRKKRVKKKGGEEARPPPGPWLIPIIGNMQLLFLKHPIIHLSFYELARRYGPLLRLRLGEITFVVASSAEAAYEIFKTHDLAFADRPMMTAMKTVSYNGQNLAWAPYGDHWRMARKICTIELLSLKRVAALGPVREEETSSFIASVRRAGATSPEGVVDLSRMVYHLGIDIMTSTAIGDLCMDKEDVLSFAMEVSQAFAGLAFADLFPSSVLLRWLSRRSGEKTREKMERIMNRIRYNRRGSKEKGEEGDLLVDVLIRMQDEGELSPEAVNGVVLDMLTAGSATTASLLETAMMELMRNPGVMERAQSEIRRGISLVGGGERLTEAHLQREESSTALSYLRLVIKETLRLHPPAAFIIRECKYRCRVLGYDVPEKARVFINLWAMGRDPKYWGDNPDEFRPQRFIDTDRDYKGSHYDYLPFGAGRRVCPGIAFGMATTELILASLLYYFDWKLPAGTGTGAGDYASPFLLCPIPTYF